MSQFSFFSYYTSKHDKVLAKFKAFKKLWLTDSVFSYESMYRLERAGRLPRCFHMKRKMHIPAITSS